jgi:acetyl-CoA decarbonylase/synthase complex subunit gamma
MQPVLLIRTYRQGENNGINRYSDFQTPAENQLQGMRCADLPGICHEPGLRQGELDSCPYVSDEAREQLAEASAPPIRPVVLGAGCPQGHHRWVKRFFTVMKKPFTTRPFWPPDYSDMPKRTWPPSSKTWNALQFERVGLNLSPELVALKDVNGDGGLCRLAKLMAETSEFNLILMSDKPTS